MSDRKTYIRQYMRQWRKDHPEQWAAIQARAGKKNRELRRDWMRVLKSKPCADCMQTFPPECMDFDHVRGTKLFKISTGNGTNRPFSEVEKEVEKCDLVCANCHRIRTQNRRLQKGAMNERLCG